MPQHVTTLDEDTLFFLTEIIVLSYLPLLARNMVTQSAPLQNRMMGMQLEASMKEALETLLRIPLQSRGFRQRFNSYFQNHPCDLLRIDGFEVLCEILSWEDD